MLASVEVAGLSKRYRDVIAVDDVSFTVAQGSVFALLGTNGAGKSTTIACLTTAARPDSGRLAVAGYEVGSEDNAIRRAIGVVFQDSILDDALTVRENLTVRGTPYFGNRRAIRHRIAELTEVVQLGEILDRKYGKLSGGQRRRADIARALIHDPRVLFLDEPTAGLDPAARQIVWRTVSELRERTGLTVFLTTHYMEETEEADRVAIVDHGHVIAEGTPAELRARHSSSILTLTTSRGIEQIEVVDSAQARRILVDRSEGLVDFEFRHGRMDDVFLAVTGHRAVAS
jgi:multidrug/hemolysin transport system ATP-binding protein